MAKAKSAPKKAKAPQTVTELSHLEPEPYVPPTPVVILFLVTAVLGAAALLFKGYDQTKTGRGLLAATLLRVEKPKVSTIPFKLPKMGGGEVSTDSFKGKVTFVNFWATWCPPCVEEMPSMRRLHQKMKDHPGFQFLAVSADESFAPVDQFFAKDPAKFTVLLDASGELAKKYGTTKFPETYVFVDGELVGFIWGPRDWDSWFAEAYFEELLKHRKIPLGTGSTI